ncbi:MAG: hypothetical protein M9963_06030 [Kiritimatiellae bacterium]|nr:hypothetical protein [Kiritimatiellia bacterium]MCO5061545.1 hypothetical protein [Kiritimatiellia bacterium]MCO6401159.1 hypothetical protein [Verrucomicrobiota bacterium]
MTNIAPKKPRTRSLFYTVFMASLMLHVGAILIISPIVLFSYFFKREVAFEPAPEVERRLEPRKLQYKVHVQETQKRSGRPQVQPRLTADRVGDISLPDIKLDIAPIKNPNLPRMANFSGSGIGTGFGDGEGSGGLSAGLSSVNFFGVRAQGERVFIIIDVSASMIEDLRGGFNGFKLVKDEVGRLIKNLSPGTFFNIGTFAHSFDQFKDNLVLANPDNKQAAISWLAKYNMPNGRLETFSPNNELPVDVDTYKVGKGDKGGSTRQDLALAHAMNQGADAVFMMTDGQPRLMRHLTDEEWEEWKKKYWTDAEKNRVAAAREREKKALEEENKRRAKRGLPPKVESEYGIAELKWPEMPRESMIDYIAALQKKLYVDAQKRPARIYVIGYETLPEDEEFLRQIARKNGGTFRHLKNLVKDNRYAQ